jgi:hypothetical protein
MKKEYIIGGLAIVGAIALIAWYKKPKENSEGFFSASGKSDKAKPKPKPKYKTKKLIRSALFSGN